MKIAPVFCPEATNAREVIDTALSLRAGIEVGEFACPFGLGGAFEESVKRVRMWIHGTSLRLSLHGAFIDINPGSPEPLVREAARKRVEEALLAANLLQAQTVVFHSGFNPMLRGPGRMSKWIDTAAHFWRSVLSELEPEATVVVENMWEPSPEPLKLLVDSVDSPRFRICLDTGHLNVFSQVLPEVWIESLSQRIVHIHLNDNNGDWDQELPLGHGTFDFPQFFNLLNSLGATGQRLFPAVLETRSLEDQMSSYRWLLDRGLIA